MNKFKCGKCEHTAEEKGFCPTDGAELAEVKEVTPEADESKKKLDDILSKLGDVVEAKVADAMKDFEPTTKEIHAKVPESGDEKTAYLKSIMDERDTKVFDAQVGEEKKQEFLNKARIAYFFKNLVRFQISKDPEYLTHVKALAEGVDADGGYLTPTEFRAQLIEDLADSTFMRSIVTVIPMNSDAMEMPTLATKPKTTWGSENTAISTTTMAFGTLTLTPFRLNSLIYTSRELVSDSAIAVVPLITRLFREAVGQEEDRVIINGSGSGQPKGILQETLQGIDNGNVDANLATNIKKLPFRLGTRYRQKGRWVMNSQSLAHVATLKDDNNNFLFKEGIEGLSPHRLAGYTVMEQNDMPLDTLLFGDFSQYFLGDREKISIETTTEGAGTFEKHQVAIKVVERIDGKVAQTLGFRTVTNAGID